VLHPTYLADMFNPLASFELRFLPLFKQKGVKAFVKQTYERGRNMLEENPRPAYLLIHFADEKIAMEHFEAIKSDPDRYIYYIDKKQDWEELVKMVRNTSEHCFYSLLMVKNVNERARAVLDKKIRRFINYKTNWNPSRYDHVFFSLDIIFGEIYVQLSHGNKLEKLKLDEFENMSYVL
jgi:hypothetical protein